MGKGTLNQMESIKSRIYDSRPRRETRDFCAASEGGDYIVASGTFLTCSSSTGYHKGFWLLGAKTFIWYTSDSGGFSIDTMSESFWVKQHLKRKRGEAQSYRVSHYILAL